VQSLREQSKIALRIGPPRVHIAMKDTPVRGAANAPLMLVEFSDYECPYCQQVKPVLDKLMAEYKDKLSLAFKDFPLPMHPRAPKAAEAAHCAGDQGKYWEYYDLLFDNKQLDVPQLKTQARALKLDGKAFDQCLDSGAKAAIVKTHSDEAQAMGVQGTPHFYINGRAIGGNRSYEDFRQIVEEELSTLAPRPQNAAKR
jgi:protein-disulfide isomerase